MKLRPYQQNDVNRIFQAWQAGYNNILYVLPTGGGKTVVLSAVIKMLSGGIAAIAHRKELIAQMSLTLAKDNINHKIIAPVPTIKFINNANYRELKTHSYDPNSMIGAVSIDTLKARHKKGVLGNWTPHVNYWMQDEAHHVLTTNKWGMVSEIFPNARGLGVTAWPSRADGQGLGRHAEGVFDIIIEGPNMRWLIDQGYLTDYRVVCPPSDMIIDETKIGNNADFTLPMMKKASENSHITGDVVQHYLKFCEGMQGITFATDVKTGAEMNNQYLAAGVKSAFVSANTPDKVRAEMVRRFRSKELQQMVNVDLFGEGFDLPSLGVVNGARPTQSAGLAAQQFGRMLRTEYAPGYDIETQAGRLAAIAAGPKPKAIFIDHVGNFAKGGSFGRHPLPDTPRVWTLDKRDKKHTRDPNIDPLKACLKCYNPYNGYLSKGSYCGYKPVPAGRSEPKFVEGDLIELAAETLRKMRGEIDTVDQSGEAVYDIAIGQGFSKLIATGRMNRHNEKKEVQQELRRVMGVFGGYYYAQLKSDSYIQRKFYDLFKIDVMTAQALDRKDAVILITKINEVMKNVR